MQDIIRLLPDAIANQIAAGEVVQRPASVIKEILENAIDAQATHIQVLVKEAGKQSIQIIDNGIGMSETDARMCFERHATSKIRKADDLFKLRTMGFRGEALASIAAIAQVELKTCRAIDDLGTMIRIEAAEIKAQEAIQQPVGTSILVKNLFYNIPARRNFLKSDNVEKHHILDEFIHIALSQPKISFVFTHNDHEIYRLPASKLSQRIIHLFGKNYKEQLAFCDETTSLVSVKGYVGKPSTSKKSKGEQYFFVNERYIKSSYLHHAVLKAYDRLISADTHPFYVLFLEIDPSRIDVNVHPKKTEIKFEDEQSVYTILLSAVRKALSMHQFVPAIDFGQDAKLDSFLNIDTKPDNRANLVSGFENERSRPKSQQIESWRRLYEDLGQQAVHQELLQSDIITQSEELQTIDSQANFINPQKEGVDDAPRRSFQILQKYLIAPIKTGLLIVDQLAARQRIHLTCS
jgi:DNA mismatch repair protein MutL